MTTRKKQLLNALRDGDTPEQLVCLYQRRGGGPWRDGAPIERMSFADIPDEPVDDGWGGTTDEELVLAFSDRYVYVLYQYDGANGFEPIPRNPESVRYIPVAGGPN